jgi:tryptophan 7-halogenase
MKIAVIGGGTAGYIAAAHLSKNFPQFELYHIYDSSIPTIGVGEGTTVDFVEWLNRLTGLSYEELEARCHITRKFGIAFENWGNRYEKFMHHFLPIGEGYAYHISAVEIVKFLQDYICATQIDNRVADLHSDGMSVQINFVDNTKLDVDLAIDARGFPKTFDENQVKFSWIPTNAALIRQIPGNHNNTIEVDIRDRTLKYQSATRSIARPHGWMFTIPLTNRTTYGYIYNCNISSVDDVEKDFDDFFRSEGVVYSGEPKKLSFPNFTQRNLFDGALFKIGNTASFIEPLEATAIGYIVKQVESISCWPLQHFAGLERREELSKDKLHEFNQYFFNYGLELSVFIGWHYANASRFDSKFWNFARSNFEREINKLENQEILNGFERFLRLGENSYHPTEDFSSFVFSTEISQVSFLGNIRNGMYDLSFNQWPKSSFAEMGYGIGYFTN